jgi:hypothetical protein
VVEVVEVDEWWWLFAGGGADDGRRASEPASSQLNSLTTPTRGPVNGSTRLPVNVAVSNVN